MLSDGTNWVIRDKDEKKCDWALVKVPEQYHGWFEEQKGLSNIGTQHMMESGYLALRMHDLIMLWHHPTGCVIL